MEIIIRPIQAGDGNGINALRRMPGVFENVLGIPSERAKRNEDWIATMGSNNHNFVATVTAESNQDLIIGNASLSVYDNPRKRHSAGIGMMVHKDYQGMGVGSRLLQALLDVADNWLMLVRVELTVFTDNEKAIHLYQKYGFEIEGTHKKAAIRNGEYMDLYTMARYK